MEPHPHSSLRSLVYNPDNSDAARLTNFQGWRTSFYDKTLNQQIDKALVERDPAKQLEDYQAIQTRYDALIPEWLFGQEPSGAGRCDGVAGCLP